MQRWMIGGPVLTLVAMCPGLAGAQQESVAEALFREAREDMKIGAYAAACPKLAESNRLDPAPGTLLNLGLCEEKLGHLATAWSKLRKLVDVAPNSDPRVALAEDRLRELGPRLPYVRIVVTDPRKDLAVRLDGVVLGPASLGRYVPVDPGSHVVSLSTLDGTHVDRAVTVMERTRTELALSFSDPAPHDPSSETKLEPSRKVHSLAIAGYVTGAVGLASLGAAVVFGGLSAHEKTILDEHCRAHSCDDDGFAAADRGARYLRISNVALAVGALSVAAGGFMIWRGSRQRVGASLGPGTPIVSYAREF